jgi:hypothetical protein
LVASAVQILDAGQETPSILDIPAGNFLVKSQLLAGRDAEALEAEADMRPGLATLAVREIGVADVAVPP